jgi:hypothetical protein
MATKRKNANERRVAERQASKRYAERERDALIAVAMDTLADRSIDPQDHALARKRLTGRDLADVEVDHLSPAELATFEALLDKVIDGTTGDVDLRVVAEARPYESVVAACATCKARRDADWINVADLDEDTRESLAEAIAELRADRGDS